MARRKRERTPEELERAQKGHWHRKVIISVMLLLCLGLVWLISFGPRAA